MMNLNNNNFGNNFNTNIFPGPFGVYNFNNNYQNNFKFLPGNMMNYNNNMMMNFNNNMIINNMKTMAIYNFLKNQNMAIMNQLYLQQKKML